MRIAYLIVCVVCVWRCEGVTSQLSVYEEQPIGTSVGRPIAEGHHFSFTKEQYQFEINTNTSEITTLVKFDSDFIQYNNISLQLRWSLLTPIEAIAFATVHILILDINDNSPNFPSSGETALFPERSPVGSQVALSSATDRDRGANGTVTYSLTTALAEGMKIQQIPFVLNVSMLPAVFLQVSDKLDYETKRIYQLLLIATDGGSPPRKQEHSVIVQILDTNDQIPTFLSGNYSYSIPEGSAVGALLGRVQAIDTDSGSGGKVVYSLVGDNIPFSVATDGYIRVSGEIDFETTERFQFQIRATNPVALEGVTGSEYSSTQVLAEVTDVNDNSPSFLFREGQSRLRLELQEELSCPTADPLTCDLIGQLRGTQDQRCLIEIGIVDDKDSGVNGEVTGVSLSPLGQEYFTPIICKSQRLMTRTAVFIYNHAPMDRENQTFSFRMSLQDGGSPRLQTDWLLGISLSDINDNSPVFGEGKYGISLAENVTQGTSILTVRATDADLGANGTVRYNISSFSPSEASAFLSIDTVTGEIRSTGPLDRESLGSEVRLSVVATDTGRVPLSSSSEVTITLTDINDNSPVFRESAYSATVSEQLAPGTAVIQLIADDRDTGFAGEVRYTMDANKIARIDRETGEVSLVTSLDYEAERTYLLSVTAVDSSLPQLSAMVQLSINVLDYNDNAPLFDSNSLQGMVLESAVPGTSVLQLSATDRDSGTNGEIRFQLAPGQSAPFLVSDSGVVSTGKELDRETAAIYTFSVVARDRALTNQLSASATVSIKVSDVDDNPPKFQYSNVVTSFLANQMLPLLIGPSIVTDKDSTEIQCSILGQSIPFLVTSTDTSCHLYATAPLTENTVTFQLNTSDTRQSVQSEVSVKTSLLSGDTINSSLVVEVSGVEQSQFLRGVLDTFLTAVSSNFKLHIWSFLPSPVSQPDLRVLLSARTAEDGALLSADSLYAELTSPLNNSPRNMTRVSPCSQNNPCIHGNCIDRVTVQSNSRSFVRNSSHIFNQLNFSITPVCSCIQGYTGERCERRINPCVDSPPCRNHGFCTYYPVRRDYVCFCQNLFTGRNCETSLSVCASSPCTNGTCMETGDTYRCVCTPGYTGARCEVYLGFCPPTGINPCMNGGTCVDGVARFKCVCVTGFVGDTCETSALCFKDTSYIQFGTNTLTDLISMPTRRADIQLSFDMRTSVHSGLVAYLQEGNTFLILELINSSLHYIARSTLQSDTSDFVEIYPTGNVSDGKWHSVTLKSSIHSGFASLTIDENEPQSGAQTDSLDSLGLVRQATLATDINLPSVSVPLTIGGLTNYLSELSPFGNLNIELSGTDTYASFLLANTSLLDYTGALRNLSVNGVLVSLSRATSRRQVYSSVSEGGDCKLDSGCDTSPPCSGHGACIHLYTDHICVCDKGHTGRDCQTATVPVTLRGKGAISFQLTNRTLESHLRTLADWSVINRTVYREHDMGLRGETEEGQDRAPQVQFYGRTLYPPQSLEIQFITRADNGVILTTRDTLNYAILEVSDGKPRFRLGRHMSPRVTYLDTTAPVTVTNASQFRINITLTREGLSLFIETEQGNATHRAELTNQIPWLVSNAPLQLVLGGKSDTGLDRYTGTSRNFSGCLSGVRVAGRELPLHQPIRGEFGVTSQLIGEVQRGCEDFGSCGTTSCPLGTTCVPVWTGIRCVCELGKEYDTGTQRCEEVDECLSPSAICHNGGQCIDGRDSYSCICTLMYHGTNCTEINAISLMIVLVVIVLFLALIALPFVLWLLFRFFSQRNSKQENNPRVYLPTHRRSNGTGTSQPFKQLREKTSQLMQDIRSNLAPKNSPLSPPIRAVSPPLVNYPPTNRMLELRPTETPVYYPINHQAHTFPSASIPTRHHGNTMPPRGYRPYSPPISNPIDPEETHSIPGKRLIRSYNIYDL